MTNFSTTGSSSVRTSLSNRRPSCGLVAKFVWDKITLRSLLRVTLTGAVIILARNWENSILILISSLWFLDCQLTIPVTRTYHPLSSDCAAWSESSRGCGAAVVCRQSSTPAREPIARQVGWRECSQHCSGTQTRKSTNYIQLGMKGSEWYVQSRGRIVAIYIKKIYHGDVWF